MGERYTGPETIEDYPDTGFECSGTRACDGKKEAYCGMLALTAVAVRREYLAEQDRVPN
jgi:hypothetical protein